MPLGSRPLERLRELADDALLRTGHVKPPLMALKRAYFLE